MLQQRICNSDVNFLQQWTWPEHIKPTFAGDLTTGGYMSAQQHARVWKTKYPGLFTMNQNNYLVSFYLTPAGQQSEYFCIYNI